MLAWRPSAGVVSAARPVAMLVSNKVASNSCDRRIVKFLVEFTLALYVQLIPPISLHHITESVLNYQRQYLVNMEASIRNYGMLMKCTFKLLIVSVYCLSIGVGSVSARNLPAGVEDAVAMALGTPHDDGKAGYIEYYLDEPVADVVRASYRSASGNEIASKQLSFTSRSKFPAFELLDYRSSSGYRVVPGDEKLRVLSLRLLENNIQAVVESRDVKVVEPLVIDVGFHRFLLSHWDDVAAGKKVRFNFLQVDRARLVPLVITRATCAKLKHYCIRVSAGNFLLRMVLPSVELTYDASTKRLLHYSGIGPLPTKSGHVFPVSLSYQYLRSP